MAVLLLCGSSYDRFLTWKSAGGGGELPAGGVLVKEIVLVEVLTGNRDGYRMGDRSEGGCCGGGGDADT